MATTITHNAQATLTLMAEGMAKVGYKPEPELMAGTALGGWYAIDPRTGKEKPNTRRYFGEAIKAAHAKALQQLSSMGCDVSSTWAQQFHAVDITPTVGITLDRSGISYGVWMVDMGKLNWTYDNYADRQSFYSVLNTLKKTINTKNVVSAKYQSYTTFSSLPDKMIASYSDLQNLYPKQNWVYLKDDSFNGSANALKAGLQGVYLLYELADPFTIPFDTPLNLTMTDLEYGDIPVLLDLDGNPMSETTVTPLSDGSIHVSQKPTQAFTPATLMQFYGIMRQYNPELLDAMLADIAWLKTQIGK